jgi:hypothetical protein
VINAIRAHLAEFGIVAPVGRNGVEQLLDVAADASDKTGRARRSSEAVDAAENLTPLVEMPEYLGDGRQKRPQC